MLLVPVLLLLFPKGVLSFHYSLTAHWTGIQHHHVKGIEEDFLSFQPHEERLFSKLKSVLDNDLHEFFVNRFEIHAESIGKPTAVFKAYLTSPLRENAILSKIQEEITVFHMLERDELPRRSVFIGNSSDGVSYCSSNGILLPNNTCACLPFSEGNTCENILCQNQGIESLGRCLCPPGYTGRFCEPQACLPPAQSTFDNSRQSFVIAMNTKSTMAYVLNTLLLQLGDYFSQVNATNPSLYKTYTIVQYIESDSLGYAGSKTFADLGQFLNYLTGLRVQLGLDEQPTMWALKTLSRNPISFSNIFVYTDSLDSEGAANNYTLSDISSENDVTLAHFTWKNKIIFFLSQPSYKSLDTSGDGYDVYRRVARTLLGDVVSYDEREISTTMNLMAQYIQNENVAVRYSVKEEQTVAIEGDTSDQNVTVVVTVEPNGVLPTISAAGKPLTPSFAGKRFLLIQTTSETTPSVTVKGSTPWSLRAFVHSTTTAVVTYAIESAADGGSSYCPADLTTSVTTAQLNSNSDVLKHSWIDIQTGNLTTAEVSSTTRTQQCSFPFSLGNISEPCTPGSYAQRVVFASNGTQTGVRILPGLCLNLDRHLSPEFVCLNNGTYNFESNQCECDEEYFGGTHCEVPICLYGGTINPFPGNGQPLCLCQEGYSGEHCDILQCSTRSQDSFDIDKRTLSVVLQNSMSQAGIYGSILTGVDGLLNQTGNGAFSQFVLTTFNSLKSGGGYNDKMMTNSYNSVERFQGALENMGYTPSDADSQPSLSAVMSTIASMTYPRSSLFLFLDTRMRSNDTIQNLDINTIIENHHELNIIVTPPFGMEDLCMDINDALDLANIAYMTGGIFINLCMDHGNYSIDPIVQLFTGYGAVQHHLETIDQVSKYYSEFGQTISFEMSSNDTLYAIVNSDVTETFNAILDDGQTKTTLVSIVDMPFLAIYEIQPNASNPNVFSITVTPGLTNGISVLGSLVLRLAEKSSIAAFISFVPDPSVDSLQQSLDYAVPFYPVVHFSNPELSVEEYALTSMDLEFEQQVYHSESAQRTDSCSYDKVFPKQYACSVSDDAAILRLDVTLTNGRHLTRSIRTFCYFKSPCLNRGTVDQYNNCECTPGYKGVYCSHPDCKNGMENENFGCTCNTGWTGKLCDMMTCETLNFWEFKETRGQLFNQAIFILNTNVDQLMVNTQLSSIMQKILIEMFFDGSDVTIFTLITFDENAVTSVITTDDNQEFMAAVAKTVSKVTPTVGSQTKALDAVQMAYMTNIDYPSIVYLFTGSEPAPGPDTLTSLLMKRVNTQVNIIYTPTNVVYPLVPDGTNGHLLTEVAKMSGGRVLPVTQGKISQIDELITTSSQENQLVFDSGIQDCSSAQTMNFSTEANFTFVTVMVTGIDVSRQGNVLIKDPKGYPVDISSSTIFQDNSILYVRISNSDSPAFGGQWSMTVKTTAGSCFVQVRVRSELTVVPAFTDNPYDDFDMKMEPFTGFAVFTSSQISFRVVDNENNTNTAASLSYLSTFGIDPNQPWADKPLRPEIHMVRKDPTQCAFQWSSYLFPMDKAPRQKLVVYGDDGAGNEFQRTYFFNVLTYSGDKDPYCLNGGLIEDGECECWDGYFGDYCDQRICKNGGTTIYGGICACQNGFYGEFCEKYLKAEN